MSFADSAATRAVQLRTFMLDSDVKLSNDVGMCEFLLQYSYRRICVSNPTSTIMLNTVRCGGLLATILNDSVV